MMTSNASRVARITVATAAIGVVLAACSDNGKSGTTLNIGEPAKISQSEYKDRETVKSGPSLTVTVTDIATANPGDFQSLKEASKYAGKTGYYVHFSYVSNGDGTPSDKASEAGSWAVYAGSTQLQRLDVMSDFSVRNGKVSTASFTQCERPDLTKLNKSAPGTKIEGCRIYLADNASDVPTKVVYRSSIDEQSVTWTK